MADIVVSVIGGRFGSESSDGVQSISQRELEKAIETEKQIYIFIERAVQIEYATYLLNKNAEGIKYQSVDDVRVFEFLEQVEKLPRNNATAPFETASDITDYLKDQWAGLFQNQLQQQRVRIEGQNLARIERTANTLDRLLQVVTESASDTNQLVTDVLLTNHPVFTQIQSLLNLSYRVFFTTRDELDSWLRSAAGFSHEVREAARDFDDHAEWFRPRGTVDEEFDLLIIFEGIFDDSGSLRPYTAADWQSDWVKYREVRPVAPGSGGDEKG